MTIIRILLLTLLLTFAGGCYAENTTTEAADSQQAQAWHQIEQGALLLDVRSKSEFESGHLAGAENIPHDQMDAILAAVGGDKARPIVVYCRSGRRSGLVQAALEEKGYTQVLNGMGYQSLVDAKPVKKPKS